MFASLYFAMRAVLAIVFFMITGIMINCAEVLSLLLLPFSRKAFRLVNKVIISVHWPILVWFIERWSNIRIKVYGDEIPRGETMLGLLNHRSDIDWVIGFAFCGRKCLLGSLKVIVKTGHKMIPIFGMMEWFVGFIFVKRNWQQDKTSLDKGMKNLRSYPKPFWFIIFPEGTRLTAEKLRENQKWSKDNGRPELKHLLWPRAKAFLMSIESLGDVIDFVYDATVVFEKEVSLFDMFKGCGNTTVHFHVKRYPMKELTKLQPKELEVWLDQRWMEKDKLLDNFNNQGSFNVPENNSGVYVLAWVVCLVFMSMSAYNIMTPQVWGWAKIVLVLFALFTCVAAAMLNTQLKSSAKGAKRR